MVADKDSPAGGGNSVGTEGAPVATNIRRGGSLGAELAKYTTLDRWTPRISDFIVYHGWFRSRWYGIIDAVNREEDTVSIIYDGLPLLLLTMDPDIYKDRSMILPVKKIVNASKGSYCILQDGVWFL